MRFSCAAWYDANEATMLKYLRIAVTAFSLTVCLLLIALWVRSYWWIDLVYGPLIPTRCVEVASIDGNIEVVVIDPQSTLVDYATGWGIESLDRNYNIPMHGVPTWSFAFDKYYANAAFPHWFTVLLSGTLAAAPWISWQRRFSLRTLLIATTLIAVVLGIVVLSR
jgi:hypothetical protein